MCLSLIVKRIDTIFAFALRPKLGLMEAPPSLYQALKAWVTSVTYLPADSVHIYLGVICLAASLLYFRGISLRLCLPGLILSIAMEVIDLYDFYRVLGTLRWGASLFDLIHTNFLPYLVVATLKIQRAKPASETHGR